jgi:hypothetical protein
MEKIYRFYSSCEEPNRTAVIGVYDNKTLKISVSRCSSEDRFIRAKARMIAEGRLKKNKIHSIFNNIESLKTEDFIFIASKLVHMVNTNQGTEKKPLYEVTPEKPYVFKSKEEVNEVRS